MSLLYYLGLLDHRHRIEAFRRGIGAEVTSGDRVLDLGCGLGTFAFFAARAGAERVAAVDEDPVVHVAHSVARINDLADRIEFVRGRIPGVELEGGFDVLVFEDFPRRLLDDRTYRLLRHVEEELLAPGARIVPRAARLSIAPVTAPQDDPADPGEEGDRLNRYGIDWSPLRPYLPNEPQSGFLSADALLAPPEPGPTLPLLPPPDASELRVAGRWDLAPDTRVDGILLWFDLEAAAGDWVSNAPGPEAGPWGQIVLPLDPPLRAGANGALKAEVRREAFSDGAPGWLAWTAAAGGGESGGHEFAARPAALEDLVPDPSGPSGEPEAASEKGTSAPGSRDERR